MSVLGQGGMPPCAESARCLFEFRGGIEDYCEAAKARMRASSHARFVVCETSLATDRTFVAARRHGLRVLRYLDVIPKAGKPPLFTVFVMAHRSDGPQTSTTTTAPGTHPSPAAAAVEDLSSLSAGDRRRAWLKELADIYTPDYTLPPVALEQATVYVTADGRQHSSPLLTPAAASATEGGGGGAVEGAAESSSGTISVAAGDYDTVTREWITVRDAAGRRTIAYSRLLLGMGKPSD